MVRTFFEHGRHARRLVEIDPAKLVRAEPTQGLDTTRTMFGGRDTEKEPLETALAGHGVRFRR